MLIERLLDQEVKYLSGGELQRVALVMALGKPADLYLIDEPSAYLDSEQRIAAAKVSQCRKLPVTPVWRSHRQAMSNDKRWRSSLV